MSVIIIRECEGRMSIMKHQPNNEWAKFDTEEEAINHIDETRNQYKISDQFHIVEYHALVLMHEAVDRKIVVTKER